MLTRLESRSRTVSQPISSGVPDAIDTASLNRTSTTTSRPPQTPPSGGAAPRFTSSIEIASEIHVERR